MQEYKKTYAPAYYKANKERIKERDAAKYAADVEQSRAKARARYAANREKILAQKKTRRDSKETNYNLLARIRNKRVREHKPCWVTWAEIREFYAACPPDKVVDHQIPIKAMRDGVHVACGLHCPANFQYPDPLINIQKSNRSWE